MLKLSRLLWAVLLACVFLVLGGGCAEAKVGLASWYGPGFEGLPTASGEPYDPYGYTAAHKTMPLGTELVVRYGGRSARAAANPRGPYVGRRGLRRGEATSELPTPQYSVRSLLICRKKNQPSARSACL